MPREGDDGGARGRLTARMELIAAVLIAGPLGYLIRSRRRSLLAYLGVWAVIFPFQTAVVLGEDRSDEWAYWPVNALILAFGIGMNHLGARLARRRAARYVAA